VFFQRFLCVSRTRRQVPAVATQKRTKTISIKLYRSNQGFAHDFILSQCLFIDSLSVLAPLLALSLCAITTISTPASAAWFCLKLSLTKRLRRFRCTARCRCFFEIAKPSLATFVELGRARMRKLLSLKRNAESKTCWYSEALVNLLAFEKEFSLEDTGVSKPTAFFGL
jgi:hypothetical protein